MRLEQLTYILEVAKGNTITKAAKNLYIAQPTLSNAITSLEEELGVEIFNRSRNGTQLTPIGKSILVKAQSAMNEINDIYRISAQNKEVDKRQIKILSIPLFCHSFIVDIMVQFKKEYPRVNIIINETIIEDIIDQLYNDVASIGLIAYTTSIKSALEKDLKAKNLQISFLFQDDFFIYLSKDHPLANNASLSMTDLEQWESVIFSDHNYKGLRQSGEGGWNASLCYLHDKESIKRMVGEYLYLTMLPSFFYQDDKLLNAGYIKAIPVRDFDEHFEIALLLNASRGLSNTEKQLVDMIIKKAALL